MKKLDNIKLTRKELIQQYYDFKKKSFSLSQLEFYKSNTDGLKDFYENYKYEINRYIKDYRKKYKEEMYQKRLLNQRKKYAENKEDMKLYGELRQKRCIESWEKIISTKTNCEICDKRIYFHRADIKKAIHFDHKNENISIKRSPTSWLLTHKYTPENLKFWLSCDFGKLCNKCNLMLPTKNRKYLIKKVFSYVFNIPFEELRRYK